MREYRMGLIQTPDQLRFSYMAVIEGANLILTDNSAAAAAAQTSVVVSQMIKNKAQVQIWVCYEIMYYTLCE